MNKRITSLFLSVVMICSLLVTAVPAWAAPGDSGVTASVTQAAPGDTFSVTLKLPGTERLISDISLKVHFDSAVFEVTEYTIPSIPGMEKMQSNVEEANSNAFFAAVYLSLNSEADIPFTDGLEVTAYFKVKADASLGDSEFKLDNSTSVASLTDMGLPDVLVKYDDFVNKSATIKVVGAPIPATGITLNPTELSMTVGDTEPLTATVTPADATDTVVWSTNDDTVATVDASGSVTAVGAGETTITATAGSVSATCTVKVSCAHNLKTVPAKDSNCTDKGWDEYQKCTLCGALFDMSGGSRSDIPYRPLNDDHDFNMGEWGYKGADGHAHVCTRNPDHKDGVVPHTSSGPATEDTAETCTVCGYEIDPATGHVCANHLTKVDRVEADCTNPGNIEHYKCSCGKLYEDATAARELTEEDVNRGALGHDWIDATCTEAKTCDRCGETEGTALGHDWEGEWSSDADNHWHACTRCDAKDGEAAHNPGAPATETTPQTCTDCGYVIASATGSGSSGGGGSSVSTYAITVKDAKNGDVSANRKSASKGTTITLTVTPDKGYVLDTIKVLDSKDNAIKLTEKDSKFTFIMPGSKVTVEATFKAETPDNPFTDVPEGSYYEDAVIWAVGKGVTGGTSATTFAPDGICTRAQAVTFLWRAAGSPAPKSSAMPFTDVKAGSDYYDAVLWAVEQGITAGTSATTFAPDLNCSRAQIVTFLYRAAGSPAVSGSPAFSDVASDAYYAKAVKWAQANGITTGIGGGLFGSDNNCTRAQIVTFIWRYAEQ